MPQSQFVPTSSTEMVYDVADLDIQKNRALIAVFQLMNAANLESDLADTKLKVDSFNNATELSGLLDLCSDETLATETIPSPTKATGAANKCGIIGSQFLICIEQLWGADSNDIISILSDQFDPELGLTLRDVTDFIQGATAIAGLIGLALLTGGTSLPLSVSALGTILTGLGLVGFGAMATQLYVDYQNGLITPEEAWGQVLLGIALNASGLKAEVWIARITSNLTARQLAALAGWGVLGADTTVDALTDYSGDINDIIHEISVLTGQDPAVIRQNLETARAEMLAQQELIDSLHIVVSPDVVLTTPTTSPGSLGYYIDPFTGDRVNHSPSSNQQAWLDARRKDYRSKPRTVSFYDWVKDLEEDGDIEYPTYINNEFLEHDQKYMLSHTNDCTLENGSIYGY